MNFVNVPGMKGIQTQVASWTQIIGGLLYALAELLHVVSGCLSGDIAIAQCFDSVPALFIAVAVAANGLGTLGLGSKVEEVKDTTKEIKDTTTSTEKTVDVIEKAV